VRCSSSRPKLDPTKLDAIIITHKHLDHAGDLSVMIEAMTEGGFKKRGLLFVPGDAIESDDPVVLKYLRNFPEKITILKEGGEYSIDKVSFSTPVRHIHRVETYGLNFSIGGENVLSLIADTKYFEGIEKYYPGKTLVINVVRFEVDPNLDHLSIPEVKEIIRRAKPQRAIITHFGMKVVQAKPWEVAEKLTAELGTEVIAARDGMEIEL
jgi:phosphoribosyl 1,2-cyclic phosphodiesterase